MTVSGIPTPGVGGFSRRRGRGHTFIAPAKVDQEVQRDPFPLEIDADHEPHAIHATPEHASNLSARRASLWVVAVEWAVKIAVLAALVGIIYLAWTGNWFGAMTDSVGSWYGDEVAPWIALDLDTVKVPAESVTTDSTLVRTGP